MINIISKSNSPTLLAIADLLYKSIKDNGYLNVKHISEAHENRPGDICIAVSPYTNLFTKILKQPNVTYVLWQTEQLPVEDINNKGGLYRLKIVEKFLPYYDYYFEYAEPHINFMKNRKWKIDGYLPIGGYHESLDYTEKYGNNEIIWDALFIGALGPKNNRGRREQIFLDINERCNIYPHTSNVYGIQLYKTMFSSKIGLNIHHDTLSIFESWRVLNLICNKKLVISEHNLNPEPLIPGKHFISSSKKDFINTVIDSVKNFEDLQQIGIDGYNFIKKHFRFNKFTKNMLNIIGAKK